MKKLALSILLAFFSTNIFAVASQDTGKITMFYVSSNGNLAIKLSNSFANASASNQCPAAVGSNYAGAVATVDPLLKSAILAAKASNSDVVIVINGCAPGLPWYNIQDIYIN